MSSAELVPGLHESLITERLAALIDHLDGSVPSIRPVDPDDQPHVLARHVYDAAVRALTSIPDHDARLTLVNRLAAELAGPAEGVRAPTRQLLRIARPPGPGVQSYGDERPSTPLSEAALLTNARGEPGLGSELRAEIDTSDQVDLLCAFVKWHGLRLLEEPFSRLRARRGPLRVITSTYLGATQRHALDRLVRQFGAEVRVHYDAQRTRLHAKAWLFARDTGFDTAYVGSSNLSRAALLDGVEWNVRLSRVGTPALFDKFRATFDTYWNDSAFESYDPDRDADRLDDALAEAAGHRTHERVTISLSGLEVRPYAYQQDILDSLEAARIVHGQHRNLVVAATGTGKTVIAALDYRRLCDPVSGERPSLLFVAHRQEILAQSLRTYREVLADASFGEPYVAGARPERWRHVFASVQSLGSYGLDNISADAFDVVVIDEFHHAAAATYRRILDRLQPRQLLGLTATPERADGVDVRGFFGGRIAAELRLWDALGADLLCPFHYFAAADGTDLQQLTWSRGSYLESELSTLYTGNQARARIILRELRDKVLHPRSMRALGFCVDVAHAEYMARVFTESGIPARAVSGRTSQHDRAEALRALRKAEVNVLFSADVFNEGLDVPDVDTILLLRPTASATVFLQQLGRGLRRTPSKAVCTVLDFVGHQRREFSWDRKLRALTGLTRKALSDAVEREFPFLPAGCQVVLDRQSQTLVLDNLKTQVAGRWRDMVSELAAYGDLDLGTYLNESGLDLADVLRRGTHSWTRLRRDAGLATAPGGPQEQMLLKRARALAHVDDSTRAKAYRELLGGDGQGLGTKGHDLDGDGHALDGDGHDLGQASVIERRLREMLFFSLWPGGGGHDDVRGGLRSLEVEAAARAELASVVDVAFADARHVTFALSGPLAEVPLRVHGRYQREEILAALGHATLARRPSSFREGVLHVRDLNADALFITLKKSEADFSPTTRYRDYPISPTLFHWESQSTTTLGSPTGQRYIQNLSTVLLFVREQRIGAFGTAPYLFLGPARCVDHRGERPIAVTWKLDRAMPADFHHAASLAAQ